MNYLRSYHLQDGHGRIVNCGDAGLELIEFGICRLQPGQAQHYCGKGKDTAIIVLGGTASVTGESFAFDNVGGRANVFEGKPHSVYLPAGSDFVVEAKSPVEFAVCQSPAQKPGKAVLVEPDRVKSVAIGRDNWQREACMIIDDTVPAEFLFIGEAIVPPGNWSSFPPHRHDKDALPDEVDMEEVYFFRFDKPGGFGIQKIYTDDRSIDETITVTENDTVLIPRGYHPVVSAPGYQMYYLWIMAGRNRKFLSYQDPAHRWVGQA